MPKSPEKPKAHRKIKPRLIEAGAAAGTVVALALAFPHSGMAEASYYPNRAVQMDVNETQTKTYESSFGNIKITGTEDFIEQTSAALALLQSRAPDYFKMVVENMGEIVRVRRGSGMNPWDNPPRFFASDRLFEGGIPWGAGDIAHDANHSRQWARYAKEHPGQPVPDAVHSGEEAERECLKIQSEVLLQIDAPKNQIDYVNRVIETRYWEEPAYKHDY